MSIEPSDDGVVAPDPTGTPPAASPPGSGVPDSPEAPGVPCAVVDALASCIGCHSSTPRYGAPMPLTSWADFHTPAVSDPSRMVWELATERIDEGSMPPITAEPMPDPARVDLREWLGAGAPESLERCDEPPPTMTVGGEEGADALPCTPTHTLTAHAPGSEEPFHVPVDGHNLYQCFKFTPTWSAGAQATAWGPAIGDDRVVHHWILYKTNQRIDDMFECTRMPSDAQFVMGWAPGGGNTVMPDDMGFELPDPGESMFLQVHYWNAAGLSDVRDDSGVAMCVTETPRAQEAGILWLGTLGINIPPRATDHDATGTCASFITRFLPGPLNILSSAPHMHELGTRFVTEVVRPGGDTEEVVRVDPWDFNNQTAYPLERPIVINPGDSLRTTCTYDNPSSNTVRFGERTEDEMCFNFVTVYPTSFLPDERRCLSF